MGSRREHAQDPRALPKRLLATFKAGAVGGIVHGPSRGQTQAWARTWRELLDQQGVPPWTDSPDRAESRVVVRGLEPGSIAWVHADGVTPVGATASHDGIARLALWHHGPAQVHAGSHSQPIVLVPGQWTESGWTGTPTPVVLP